jgi:hypothetical protein
VAHPQKTVEKAAESVGEAVSHPGKTVGAATKKLSENLLGVE